MGLTQRTSDEGTSWYQHLQPEPGRLDHLGVARRHPAVHCTGQPGDQAEHWVRDRPVTEAFKQNNITLTTPVKVSGDKLTLDPSVVVDLVNGTVPGPLEHALIVRGIPGLSAEAKVSASVTVTVRDPGRLWTLQDLRTASSYKISLDPEGKQLDVVSLVPIAPLHDYVPKAGATYLSMAAEPKGHMYILSYTGDGSSPEDYQLDIYQPNGPWLTRTAGLNAAKIVVDMWRNLYTLNYEALEGAGARTEPSVSTWVPSS